MKRCLKTRRRYVVFLKKDKMSFEDVRKLFVNYFGELTFLKANLKLIKEDEKFLVVRCNRGFEDKIVLLSLFVREIHPIKICGSIKKVRRVIENGVSNDGI